VTSQHKGLDLKVNLYLCLTKYHAMKTNWERYGVTPCNPGTSGGEWSESGPGRFTPGE